MQVLAPAASSRWELIALVRSALVAILLLVVGGLLAWTFLTTSIVWALVPAGRPSGAQIVLGIAGLAFAILLPTAFVVLGALKAAATVGALGTRLPRRALPHLAHALGPDHLAAEDLVLPDGRRIHELILGPFGVVVLGAVPPASVSRHVGRRWEIRDDRGRWLPIEPPVERAARDAERVRRWLGSLGDDFVVKVHALIVTDDRRVERTPACAVVASGELAAWLEGLPPQRGLTADRRERVAARIREVAVGRRSW
jgi:hypothetical protein